MQLHQSRYGQAGETGIGLPSGEGDNGGDGDASIMTTLTTSVGILLPSVEISEAIPTESVETIRTAPISDE